MPTVSGVIANINTRNVNIKKGPKAGSIAQVKVLEMDDGGSYEWGFGTVPAGIGDTVTFNWDMAYGKPQVDKASFARGGGIASAAASAPPAAAPKPSYQPRESRVFPVPLLHGDRAIIRQNALAHATKLMAESRAALIGAKSTVAEYDKYVELIIDAARKFESYACGDDERHAAEQAMNKKD